MAPTLKDISKQMDVSLMTVSRALRGVAGVSDELREQIRTVAREMGYTGISHVIMPTSLARGGRDASMKCLIPVLEPHCKGIHAEGERISGYTQEVVAGMTSRLKAAGGRVEMVFVASADDCMAAVDRHQPDVVVLRESLPVSWIEAMRARVAVVSAIASDMLADVDCVSINEHRAAAQIQRHLAALGHQRVVWFGLIDYSSVRDVRRLSPVGVDSKVLLVDQFLSTSTPRHAAWSLFTHCEPRLYSQRLVLENRDHATCSLPQAIRRGLKRILDVPLARRPTAITVSSFYMADEALRQLRQRGLRVPQDISLVSYGIKAEYRQFPGIRATTHVLLPMYRIGQCVPEIAERRIANPEAEPVSMHIQTMLLAGNTTGPVVDGK